MIRTYNDDITSIQNKASDEEKPRGLCLALRNLIFPDKEEMTQKQIEKFDKIIKDFQKEISSKESMAIKLRSDYKIAKSRRIKTSENFFNINDLRQKISVVLDEINMLRKFQKIFSNAKFKLEKFKNTSLVTNELKMFQRNFNINVNEITDINGAISDMNVAMSEADTRFEQMNKNMWVKDDDGLEDDLRMFIGEDEDFDIDLPDITQDNEQPKVYPKKRERMAILE